MKVLYQYDFLGFKETKVLEDVKDILQSFEDYAQQVYERFTGSLRREMEDIAISKNPSFDQIERLGIRIAATEKPTMIWYIPDNRRQALKASYVCDRTQKVTKLMV